MIRRYHFFEPFRLSLSLRTVDSIRIGSFVQAALCPTLNYSDQRARSQKMGAPFWEELLGSSGRCVRGVVLISTDGRILKSTLSHEDALELNTQWIATIIADEGHQKDIRTDTGWILAAPINKRQILVVVIECGPYTHFNLDLIGLFADDSASDDDSRLPDPTIVPQPPKHGGAHAIPEYQEE
jgi:predicted regulator of Ras-like GTPase activity (Roadblock/LC7/MglB family)